MDEFLIRLGNRIKEIRMNNGWSPYFLASKLDTSIEYIHRVESGNWNMSVQRLLLLATVFEISISDLVEGLDIDL